MTPATKVGISVHESLMVADSSRRRRILDLVSDAGIDHVCVVTPAGTPVQVTEWLAPFVGQAEHINLIPAASSPEAGIDYVAEVRAHLLAAS